MTFSADSPLVIGCYGDSTMLGLTFNGTKVGPVPGFDGTISSVVPVPGPEGFGALVASKYGPLVTVSNRGVSGNTCSALQAGAGGVPRPWTAEMATTDASVVVVGLGINDDPADLASIYPLLVADTIAAGKRFVVQTPNALDISWGSIDGKVATELQIAAANNLPVIDFNEATSEMGEGWRQFLSYSFPPFAPQSWSGIHPNPDGYRLMSAAMWVALDQMIGRMLDYPDGRMGCAPVDPGMLMVVWTCSGLWSLVNVLDAAGKDYWNGASGVEGVSYATGRGNGGEAIFTLPPGTYAVELCGYWQDAWRVISKQAVTIT